LTVVVTYDSVVLLARLMCQYCFACWRLSSSSVTLPAAGCVVGRHVSVGNRHCMADLYSYVPLGRHLVLIYMHDSGIIILITNKHFGLGFVLGLDCV